MTSPTSFPLHLPVLHTLSTLTLSGTDAHTYLQGQLSNDLRLLTADRALLASCNSAQGRVQAVLTLIERPTADGTPQILLLLPPSLRLRLLPRLKLYILRAKVQISDAAQWALVPLAPTHAATLVGQFTKTLPAQPGDVVHLPAEHPLSLMRWWSHDERYLLVAPSAAVVATEPTDGSEPCLDWRHADIAAGLPQVFPETWESFVAQMLNLDVLNGISFTKGCYTGQEIIARTHYRGSIKRRLLRYRADGPAPTPGTRITQAGNSAGEVVDSVDLGDTGQRCELLAVMSLDQTDQALALPDGTALTPLPLPYSLT